MLLLAGSVLSASSAPTACEIDGYVIGGGGGRSEADGYTLRATAGQPVTGEVRYGRFDLCSGFWCEKGRYTVFVPLVLRDQ
jgi:hypothetical protein